MFSIYDGRDSFYQWDKDRKIIVDDNTIKEVHFCNKTDDCSLVVKTYTENELTLADVPNILLTTDWKIRVFGYTGDFTKFEACFKVNGRSKPADYVYTETEIWNAETAIAEAFEEAKANGDFKGDKGDKGDAGSIKFQVVTELPTENIDESAIYLVPTGIPTESNTYSEYIFANGAWECIGSASVEVNLDEYVKNTDYARLNKAGVIRIDGTGTHGLGLTSDGNIFLHQTTQQEIDSRKAYKAITANRLDYAVKTGLTTNTEEWTEEEKASARELIGADSISKWELLETYELPEDAEEITDGLTIQFPKGYNEYMVILHLQKTSVSSNSVLYPATRVLTNSGEEIGGNLAFWDEYPGTQAQIYNLLFERMETTDGEIYLQMSSAYCATSSLVAGRKGGTQSSGWWNRDTNNRKFVRWSGIRVSRIIAPLSNYKVFGRK